jgi:serine/threonine-protein kinase RsbW
MSARGERISLTLPASFKYLQTARLLAGGVGARAELGIPEVEDLKVAVSEACTNACEHAFEPEEGETQPQVMKLDFYVSDGRVTVEIEDEGRGFDPKHLPDSEDYEELKEESGLGLYLVRELMDEVEVQSAPGSGTKIIMTKRASG